MSSNAQPNAPIIPPNNSAPQRWARWPALLFGITLLVGTLAYFVPTFSTLTRSGYPYEAWDEIAGYNTSFVLAGEHTRRAHFYGTLDIAKFVLADTLYTRADPIGMTLRRVNYTNNVPETLEDYHVFYGPNFWAPQALGAIEYVYFRGVQDRTPIFWARAISMGLCMVAYLVVGLLFLRYAGPASPWLIGALALFVCQPTHHEQFSHALPNAFNALLIGGAWFLSIAILRSPSRPNMILLGCLLGIAVNSKFDAIIYTSGAGLAALAAPWIGRRFSVRPFVDLIVSFAVILVLTNPYLWFDPVQQLEIKRKFLSGVGVGSPSLSNNWEVLAEFAQNFFSAQPNGTSFISAGIAGLLLLTIAAVGLILPLLLDHEAPARARWARFFISFTFLAFALLVPLLFANTLYARYFLPALCLILCQFGYAIAPPIGQRSWRKAVAAVVLVAFLASFLVQAKGLSHLANWLEDGLARRHGLDPRHSRNHATLHVIDQLMQQDERLEILVDQHSYIDLRAFLKRGKQPILVNALNFERVLQPSATDPDRPRIVIYTPGTSAVQPDWKGRWKPEMETRYAAYIATLEQLPTLAAFGQNPAALLEWAPPGANDLVKIARLR